MQSARLDHAAVLLAVLDAALEADTDGPRAAGMAAAIALHRLLAAHRLVWDDVVTPASRLAKLCGCLGSDYAGEQSAAYDHAVRLLRRRRATWSSQVRLPVAPPRALPSAPRAAPAVAPAPPPARAAPRRQWDEHATGPTGPIAAPPETDWITTVRQLQMRAGWPPDMDHHRMDSLARRLVEGEAIDARDARWLRDLWWWQELNDIAAAEPVT
jgi:hypothetical protein